LRSSRGGHTFGKTHGAGPRPMWVPSRKRAPIEEQGLGWKSSFARGKGADAITSVPGSHLDLRHRRSGANNSFWNLFSFEWELTQEPRRAHQWTPKGGAGAGTVHMPTTVEAPLAPAMLTTDLSLRFDPAYRRYRGGS